MAVTVNFYDHFLEILGDGTLDMDGHTFTVALMDATHVFTAANTLWSQVSANELATAGGYTSPGLDLTGVTWAQTAGVVTFDFTDPLWTATAAGIGPTTDAVIYDNTSVGTVDALVCSIDFGASHTAADGADLKLILNASGLFDIT